MSSTEPVAIKRRLAPPITLMVKFPAGTVGATPVTVIVIGMLLPGVSAVLLNTVTTPVELLIVNVPLGSLIAQTGVPVWVPSKLAVPSVVPLAEPARIVVADSAMRLSLAGTMMPLPSPMPRPIPSAATGDDKATTRHASSPLLRIDINAVPGGRTGHDDGTAR